MPVIFRYRGYKFFFYSNEGNPLEPAHIHVRMYGKEAKFWLSPEVSIARNNGLDARTMRILLEVVEHKQDMFKEQWYEYFA
ncbi:MAG: DUF4160 domain-containing protein [Bacteroidota bacterium]|nr:DUF4160 domain-containing protein [Bacteroidota bacterium]